MGSGCTDRLHYVEVEEKDYNKVIRELQRFIEYPVANFEIVKISDDQPRTAETEFPAWVQEAAKQEDEE